MRSLLAVAATTEAKPIPYYSRLLKSSVEFAESCRFGHTYRGSFGFVVESPLPESTSLPLLPNSAPVPFERRIVQRLARGMETVAAARSQKQTTPITSAVTVGFGANGCEVLADLIESVSPTGLNFSFDLSPEWDSARDMDTASFSLDAGDAEICRSAARELRRSDAEVPVHISGRVIRLQNHTDPTDLSASTGEHEVSVVWASEDFGDIIVRIHLNPADYLAAVGAHGAGRPIWISGNLRKSGRQWVLSQPQSFRIPAQSELPFDETNR
jgi:hypothetical protein